MDVDGPPAEVFDFVADERSEPRYNPRMTHVEQVSRMRWTWHLEPRGALRYAGPLVRRMGERQEQRIWSGLKRLLGAPPEGAAPRTPSAIRDFAGSVRGWGRLVAERRMSSPRDRMGTCLHFEDGTSSVVFRETGVTGVATSDPTLLVIQFRLAALGSNRLLHAAFRRECAVHTPLFAGFSGFRSKLWAEDVRTGVYRGIYEWDGADRATAYADRMVALLAPFSTAGSARYKVVPGLSRAAFLAAPDKAPADPAGGWWQLARPLTS